MPPHLAIQDLHRLDITVRVASSFSLAGTSFVIFSFLVSPMFRKPINRLIFYASLGNIVCNVATLMAQSPIRSGPNSHICQFQSFLIQWLLPADALWNMALAINVYLTLFRRYKAEQLRALEWRYWIMCYGLPFVVAFICLFISTPARGKLYGPATLWCSTSTNWNHLRIALVYAPAWFCGIVAFSIYILAGNKIFQKRKQLRACSQPSSHQLSPYEENQDPFKSFNFTNMPIVNELELPCPTEQTRRSTPTSQNPEAPDPGRTVYTKGNNSLRFDMSSALYSSKLSFTELHTQIRNKRRKKVAQGHRVDNTAAWKYTKVALLFFISMLVTWLPSSVNRVYTLTHPSTVSLPLSYATAVVLPLMGFWNSLIYIITSWHSVRMLLRCRLTANSQSLRPRGLRDYPKTRLGHRRPCKGNKEASLDTPDRELNISEDGIYNKV